MENEKKRSIFSRPLEPPKRTNFHKEGNYIIVNCDNCSTFVHQFTAEDHTRFREWNLLVICPGCWITLQQNKKLLRELQ